MQSLLFSLFPCLIRSSIYFPTWANCTTPAGTLDPKGGREATWRQVEKLCQKEGRKHQGFCHIPWCLQSARVRSESSIQGSQGIELVVRSSCQRAQFLVWTTLEQSKDKSHQRFHPIFEGHIIHIRLCQRPVPLLICLQQASFHYLQVHQRSH